MTTTRDVSVFYDPRMLDHDPDVQSAFLPGRLDRRVRQMLEGLSVEWSYPEEPKRLTSVRELLRREPLPGIQFRRGHMASEGQLTRVHAGSYVRRLLALSGESAWLDVDTTAVSPGSIAAARVAAGTTIKAVESVFEGPARRAFALVRPPGHHAESVRARGFCLFNNVAAACAHAQSALGCAKVLIIDWDAHHGNGTQEIFYADPTVLFFDIHRAAPFYPGSGGLDQVGVGLGEGTTINVPLPAGSGDGPYLHTMRKVLVPAADWFEPDLVLVSAGFDPHPNDLAMNVSLGGFEVMTSIVMDIAERHCEGRLVFALEGGYNRDSLGRGVHAVLQVLTGLVEPVDPPIVGMAEAHAAAEFHRSAFVDEDS